VPLREVVIVCEAGSSFGASTRAAADDGWGVVMESAISWGECRASEKKAVAADQADIRYEISNGDLP